MYSINAGKSIHKNKKAQKKFYFALTIGPKIKMEFMNEKSLKPPPRQAQLDYKCSD